MILYLTNFANFSYFSEYVIYIYVILDFPMKKIIYIYIYIYVFLSKKRRAGTVPFLPYSIEQSQSSSDSKGWRGRICLSIEK